MPNHVPVGVILRASPYIQGTDSKDSWTARVDLTGKLLVAMPHMGDFRFERSVVYLCAHSPEGAMGLIVNKPAQDLSLQDVLAKLDVQAESALAKMPVYFGGPVETTRGFVLHSDEYSACLDSLEVSDGFAMTATQDILEDIAAGSGPARALIALGYAGWGPGQLEQELVANGWLTAEPNAALVFGPDAKKWEGAIRSLGIDPLALSTETGRA